MKMKLIVEYEITIFLSHTNTVDKKGGDKKTDIQKYIINMTYILFGGVPSVGILY
jgi:hypothetical protein